METAERTDKGVKTVWRTFRIIEILREEDGATTKEVADRLDVANSTAYRYLATLHDIGYITKEDQKYQIALRFLRLGRYSKERKQIYELAEQRVELLAEETGERVQFVSESHGRAVLVSIEMGERAVVTDSKIGKELPIHSTSAGKAILAHLPEDRLREIVERHGLSERTKHTISSRAALEQELAEIRDRGYSYNRQESTVGLSGVGVPVLDGDDTVLGALSVVGATNRIGDRLDEKLPSLLLAAANELELDIAHA